jgi:hypothetical protein
VSYGQGAYGAGPFGSQPVSLVVITFPDDASAQKFADGLAVTQPGVNITVVSGYATQTP